MSSNFMKKILAAITLILLFLPVFTAAQEIPPVYLTLFYGQGCPHCAKEKIFLASLQKEFPNLKIRELEIWYNSDNAKKMAETAKFLNINAGGIPLTIICQDSIIGYADDQTTGERIKSIVKRYETIGCVDAVGEIIGEEVKTNQPNGQENKEPINITLPFFGQIDARSLSLPVLTVAIGAVDGFNPCAMWVLIFLISLLLGMEDKKKMWLLGSAFILASAFVYFLFMSAWLNFFLFIGFISLVRIGIGLVAIGSGGYHLREWWVNKDGVCQVAGAEKKQKIMAQLRRVTEQKSFWLALIGIIALAFAVNLLELVCSAGLPAIYTQTLSLANLSPLAYYSYLLLYILIFMLDDILVFAIAMTTLRIKGISAKYSRWSSLIGGVVILILGLLLIFKPGWIMFG
ncbi:MAG: hypothetical protein A2663_01745 [Candidatus Buchananbacteria bacterium RIFCSPHIGHO2_01_FULL_46_12]|uniref:Thioredoxin domain-containing protein n=3 Tax=Candidatus Buchananiibacteriota TaxID=1817903 RepID=A0A1G1Y6T5_9BACT|nr:MAG: hypothetical protein A2663_01745 [Candidatus Buchananbacteria bacterium RIFCSPHIGHO2_01_FULL_46_12]OGY56666.1 MAG: hypothetical protein A3H67_00530 [Candidatus Buchananbacteria bacterium RIFCSPLOWO2_02_FULL_46_11b]